MILFDWLVDVQGEYQLEIETLHTAFLLIDRCLQLMDDLPRDQIQLLGASCMFIAAKYCETSHPSITEMVWVCDSAYSHDDHRSMEMKVLFATNFLVRSVTPCSFIAALCQLVQLPDDVKLMANYLADVFLLHPSSIGILPSAVAGVCILLAMYNSDEAGAQGLAAQDAGYFARRAVTDVAFLTQRPAGELCKLACKVQLYHWLDYLANSQDKDCVAFLAVPPLPLSGQNLRAVYDRHSKPRVLPRHSALAPPALRVPRKVRLTRIKGPADPVSGIKVCCWWCRDASCAHMLLNTFSSNDVIAFD